MGSWREPNSVTVSLESRTLLLYAARSGPLVLIVCLFAFFNHKLRYTRRAGAYLLWKKCFSLDCIDFADYETIHRCNKLVTLVSRRHMDLKVWTVNVLNGMVELFLVTNIIP